MFRIKAFFYLVLFGMCIFLSAPSAQAVPMAHLELSSSDIFVGDTFSVSVIVDGVTDMDPFFGPDELLAFGFNIDVNSTEFLLQSVDVAPPFFDDSFLFPSVEVAGSAFPGLNGDGILLANLNLQALMPGSFMVGITSDLRDLNQGLITFLNPPIDLTSEIEINVNANVVPIPAPILLFLSGLGYLGVFRYKKKI